jgi:hypothetical protein
VVEGMIEKVSTLFTDRPWRYINKHSAGHMYKDRVYQWGSAGQFCTPIPSSHTMDTAPDNPATHTNTPGGYRAPSAVCFHSQRTSLTC